MKNAETSFKFTMFIRKIDFFRPSRKYCLSTDIGLDGLKKVTKEYTLTIKKNAG